MSEENKVNAEEAAETKEAAPQAEEKEAGTAEKKEKAPEKKGKGKEEPAKDDVAALKALIADQEGQIAKLVEVLLVVRNNDIAASRLGTLVLQHVFVVFHFGC